MRRRLPSCSCAPASLQRLRCGRTRAAGGGSAAAQRWEAIDGLRQRDIATQSHSYSLRKHEASCLHKSPARTQPCRRAPTAMWPRCHRLGLRVHLEEAGDATSGHVTDLAQSHGAREGDVHHGLRRKRRRRDQRSLLNGSKNAPGAPSPPTLESTRTPARCVHSPSAPMHRR